MIRKFSVTNTHSNQSGGSVSTSEAPSTTGSGPIASPTSLLESQLSTDQESKKLYAQSLESTENSVVNEQSEMMSGRAVDPLLYPVDSEHDTSTDGETSKILKFPFYVVQTNILAFLDFVLYQKRAIFYWSSGHLSLLSVGFLHRSSHSFLHWLLHVWKWCGECKSWLHFVASLRSRYFSISIISWLLHILLNLIHLHLHDVIRVPDKSFTKLIEIWLACI